MAVPGKSPNLLKKIISILVNITCDGEPVSSLYGCVSDGVVCSGQGTCTNNKCVCDSGYKGTFCETIVTTSSSDSGTIIGIVLGNTIACNFRFHSMVFFSQFNDSCVFQVLSYQ